MKITVLTMFPTLLDSVYENPIVKRAVANGSLELKTVDIKPFAGGSFRHIDDSPYGGGNGMIIRADVLDKALNSVKGSNTHSVLLSPKGTVYNQRKAESFSKTEDLVIVCGHYEGVDARFEACVDELVSIGDFVLTGGESAAVVIVDSISRLLDGTLKDGVTSDESHQNMLLEYPQFTHPYEFNTVAVPQVLLSGDDAKINEWKHRQAVEETIKYRPDLAFEYMKTQIKNSEDSFRHLFSEEKQITSGIVKYSDCKLPDMYDHNMYVCSKIPSEDEVQKCISDQNFVKFESSLQWPKSLIEKFGFEEDCTFTMSIIGKADSWETNPDLQIRSIKNSAIAKQIIDIEVENYGQVYGTDFVLRKMHSYLTMAENRSKLDFVAACIDDKVVGFCYTFVDCDCVGIDDLFVIPDFRHKKVATTLLKYCIGLDWFTYLHADEDDTPKDMYSKLGFTVTDRTWNYFKKLN